MRQSWFSSLHVAYGGQRFQLHPHGIKHISISSKTFQPTHLMKDKLPNLVVSELFFFFFSLSKKLSKSFYVGR